MIERAYLITEPHRVLAFASDQTARSMSLTAWGKEHNRSAQHAMIRDGTMIHVDHCRYRPGSEWHCVHSDVLGRNELHLTLPMIAALAAAPDGTTGDHIVKLFEERSEADAAMADLSHSLRTIRAIQAIQAALDRMEAQG